MHRIRKTVYLILSAILGVLLLLVLQKILMQLFILLFQPRLPGLAQSTLNLIDFISILLALGIGTWYGAWIGSYWYSVVYAGEQARGFWHHMRNASTFAIGESFVDQKSSWQLDDLFKAETPLKPQENKNVIQPDTEWQVSVPVVSATVKQQTVKKRTARKPIARKVADPVVKSVARTPRKRTTKKPEAMESKFSQEQA